MLKKNYNQIRNPNKFISSSHFITTEKDNEKRDFLKKSISLYHCQSSDSAVLKGVRESAMCVFADSASISTAESQTIGLGGNLDTFPCLLASRKLESKRKQ